MRSWSACGLLAALSFGVSQPALALKPEVSLHGQYGAGFNNDEGLPSLYGFGLGARAGLNLASFYVGAVFDYNFGASEADTSLSSYGFAGEAGYNLSIPVVPITVRPRLGLGVLVTEVSTEVLGLDIAGGDSSPLLIPGLSVHVKVGGNLFVGAELSVYVPTDDLSGNEKSITTGLCVGWAF